jgi:hypothetical protein
MAMILLLPTLTLISPHSISDVSVGEFATRTGRSAASGLDSSRNTDADSCPSAAQLTLRLLLAELILVKRSCG